MTTPALPPPRPARRAARRSAWRGVPWSIVLPFAGGVGVIVLLVILALVTGRSAPLADIFLTVLILCPLAICVLPIYIVLIALVYFMRRANQGVDSAMRRVGQVATAVEDRALDVTNRAAGLTVRLNSGFARLEKLVHRFINPHHPAG